jgi:hypothetical protein
MNVPTQSVTILDAPQGLLYTMKSPDFTVQSYDPFDMLAIGSGEGLKKKIIEVSDQIFFGTIPNSDIHFLRSDNVESVGGAFTMVKLTAAGPIPFTRETLDISKKEAYRLDFEHGHRVQRNMTTGKEIRLLLPWELDQSERADHKFDDLRPKP